MEKKNLNIKQEMISPAIAEIYLKRNMQKNRRIRQRHVDLLAADMAAGRWETDNPQNMIVFYSNGELADGQHRLKAIIKSGVTVPVYVCRGVDPSTHMFDKGAMRSTQDVLLMSGYSRDVANTTTVALTRFLFEYVYAGSRRLTDGMVAEYIENHGAELWISTKIGKKSTSNRNALTACSPIYAAIYCAYRYGIHEDELRNFISVCQSGIQEELWQTPAVLLRNYILNASTERPLSPNNYRKSLFLVASQALYDYRCKKRRKIRYQPDKIVNTVFTEYVIETDAVEVKKIING